MLILYNLLVIKIVKLEEITNNTVKDFGYFPSLPVKTPPPNLHLQHVN